MQSLMRLTKWIGNFKAIRAPFMKSHLIVSNGLPENDFDAHNVVWGGRVLQEIMSRESLLKKKKERS